MSWAPLATILHVLGLAMAYAVYRHVTAQPAGAGAMIEIAAAIDPGATALLRKEYSILVWLIVVVAVVLARASGPSPCWPSSRAPSARCSPASSG